MSENPAAPVIRFTCSNCRHEVSVPATDAGKETACPNCRAALFVPLAAGEAPAPAVAAVAAGVPPASSAVPELSAQTMPGPALEAPPAVEAPVVPAVAVGEKVEGGQAVVQVASAPAPAPLEPTPATAPYAPYGRYIVEPPPRRSGKFVAVALGLVAAVAILACVGLAIHGNVQHARKVEEIERLSEQASAALKEGRLLEAAQCAAVAQAQRQALDRPVEAAQAQRWDAVQGQVREYEERLAEIDRLVAEAEPAPGKVLERLNSKRLALAGAGPAVQPLLEKVEAALAAVNEMDRRQRITALTKEVEEAEKEGEAGQIESAAEKAGQLLVRMGADEKLREPGLQARVEKLQQSGRQLREARNLRAAARRDYEDALKRLEDLAAQLKREQAGAPLLSRLEDYKKQIVEERKRNPPLTPAEQKRLQTLAAQWGRQAQGLESGDPSEDGLPLRYEGRPLRLRLGGLEGVAAKRPLIEADGQRFLFPEKTLRENLAGALQKALALGEAMRQAKVPPAAVWEPLEDVPFPCARAEEEQKVLFFHAGKVYSGPARKPPYEEKTVQDELAQAAEGLAEAVEKDAPTSEDVRKTVSTVVRGACKELDPHDYLPGYFCRPVLHDGYIEKNLPGAAERLKVPLARYNQAYERLTALWSVLKGRTASGDEAALLDNHDKHRVFWGYDKASDTTTFAIKHPVDDQTMLFEHPLLFVVYEFPGRHETLPEKVAPKVVRVVHPVEGVMASYDPATKQLAVDEPNWIAGAKEISFKRRLPWMGEARWAFPPHVVYVDLEGNPTAIVTQSGRVDLPHFAAITGVKSRRQAQDKYLDALARVLVTPGDLHLYFLYFHQYVLDSPIETNENLLGSRAHCGDIHQTVYESLDRELAGRYMGDCDDLAELYREITRRQGKLSYVLGLPGHAACGWVERMPNGYSMQFVDTGPPRRVEGTELEKVVEAGERTYDRDKTLRFDPKAVIFLFRFAGERTRTPYLLSSRMFVDADYADVMERVQSYWHFHFYALGIKTMEEKVAKGDKVPENYMELAGLYQFVRESKKSAERTEEALRLLGPEDAVTRLSERVRVGVTYRLDHDKTAAFTAVRPAVEELNGLPKLPASDSYVQTRMELSALLTGVDKPWIAWGLIRDDIFFMGRRRPLPFQFGAQMTTIYAQMQELIQEKGYKPTDNEEADTKQLESVLKVFYKAMLFEEDDDFNEIQQKYAFLGRFYAAQFGKAKWYEELLKDGPFPDPAKLRKHEDRSKENMAEDWKWIRLSLVSYGQAVGEAIDFEEPPETWHRDDAVKLIEAMLRAAVHTRQFGSLASSEHLLFEMQVLHACLTKKWDEFEGVLKEVQKRDYARLTSGVAETFGRCAKFITPEEFAAQFKVFSKYMDSRQAYFDVVYEAYRMECYDHARAAARLSLERWPDEGEVTVNMKREAEFLDELIKNRRNDKKPNAGGGGK